MGFMPEKKDIGPLCYYALLMGIVLLIWHKVISSVTAIGIQWGQAFYYYIKGQ